MRRLKIAGVVLLALLTAGQLALHHHSLAPETGNAGPVCAICTFSADEVRTPSTPTITLAFIGFVAPAIEAPAHSVAPLLLATRGPPEA